MYGMYANMEPLLFIKILIAEKHRTRRIRQQTEYFDDKFTLNNLTNLLEKELLKY